MNISDIKNIVVHTAATKPHMDIGFKQIDQWHKSRGWSGCGYHFIIRRDGVLEHGRPLHRAGAHTKGHNMRSWGICMVGGLDSAGEPINNYTHAQFVTLYILINGLLYIAPHAELLGHRDLSPDVDGDGIIEKWEWLKDCPCFDVREWRKSFKPVD